LDTSAVADEGHERPFVEALEHDHQIDRSASATRTFPSMVESNR